MKDVIIVGGGVSGITCAIELKKRGLDVLVLESLDKCLKKVLVTGNGRCNYWNENFDNSFFYSDNSNFIREVNIEENRNLVSSFFNEIGLIPVIKNGYYYPMSLQASSVRNALLKEANIRNIEIISDLLVNKITKEDNIFNIYSNDKIHKSKNVVIATGSNSYYKEKSLGYSICESFGHKIIPVLPSLVQLVGKEKYFKDWNGARNSAKVSILVDGVKKKEEVGEVMLTDYGLSGICIFNLSIIAATQLNKNKKVEVVLNFLKDIDNVFDFLTLRNKKVKGRTILELLEGLMNYKIINVILQRASIDKTKTWNELSTDEKERLCKYISSFDVSITGTKSFDSSQVCSGGVDTKEIDSKTMESKICKGLYVVGEVLDVVGECGGYNLGFAFLSSLIAGRSVNK